MSKWPKNHAAITTGFENIQIPSNNVICYSPRLSIPHVMASKLDSVSGDSMAIFIRDERLYSPRAGFTMI